ncbi:hypothetical protein IFM89_033442 [Coptis chinensis]|uniref:Uncharacterized protein n=1 Tax=Coptis chinensis TaxID=261450 RepID=A0A835HUJ3_9MAGN|nr:hypothetical protein IFM89_033442 [Coptis chinensis]
MEIDEAIPIHNKPARHLSTKKHGFLNLVRIAVYMIKRRSAKTGQVEVASKGLWKRLVGAMRPLHHQHLQHQQSPRLTINVGGESPYAYTFHDVPPTPMSPPHGGDSPFSSSTSDGTKSRYASALNLQELAKESDETDENIEVVIEEGYFEDGGDELIDARAEEFIANFYEEMRLQRLESITRYNEMIQQKGQCVGDDWGWNFDVGAYLLMMKEYPVGQGILNIVHSQVQVILSRFDIGLLPRNKFPSELMVREVKKESTSVACSFMAVLFEQGLGFGPL